MILSYLFTVGVIGISYLSNDQHFVYSLSFSSGASFNCFVFDEGTMKCWGANHYGQLGIGTNTHFGDSPNELGSNLPFVNIGTGRYAMNVFCGGSHTCLILDDDSTKCWGSNYYGQLASGTPNNVIGDTLSEMGDNLLPINLGTKLIPISFALGTSHSCALFTNKKVKCFGTSFLGAVGYESYSDIGRSPMQLGDNLPFVNFGSGAEVSAIFSSPVAYHTCVILITERMKCWGSNGRHQLGYGDTLNRGNFPNQMGDYLPNIELGSESKVKLVSVGAMHTCALCINDEMKCWGSNIYGQLGLGSSLGASIYSMGSLANTPYDSTGKKIIQFVSGTDTTCVLLDDYVTFKCVGSNNFGQLGQGDKTMRGDTMLNTLDKIPAINLGTGSLNIQLISSGYGFSCVVFADSSIKCFGVNIYGALGIGSTSSIGTLPSQMGNNLKFASINSASLRTRLINRIKKPIITTGGILK